MSEGGARGRGKGEARAERGLRSEGGVGAMVG